MVVYHLLRVLKALLSILLQEPVERRQELRVEAGVDQERLVHAAELAVEARLQDELGRARLGLGL